MHDPARLYWIIPFSLLGSVGAVALSATLLLVRAPLRTRLVPPLVSYAAGTLLGAALLGLLPEALRTTPPDALLPVTLAGLVLFFVLERALIWRHCHEPSCERHSAAGPLILIGDAFHNLADGVILAAAFLVSVPLGIGTAVAVIVHELPQEVGDFALLLDSGYSPRSAFAWNALSALATLPGAVGGYALLASLRPGLPYVMALSAASFLYIALADLVPHLHRRGGEQPFSLQLALMAAGIGTIVLVRGLAA
jgi:zinc and cadmium transporter